MFFIFIKTILINFNNNYINQDNNKIQLINNHFKLSTKI